MTPARASELISVLHMLVLASIWHCAVFTTSRALGHASNHNVGYVGEAL